ncbi:DUF3139 domain-containing protein [Fredinandcohnia humi]
MKKRKIIYMIIFVLLGLFVLFFYNELNGNPISKFYASKTVEKYLSETYPNREFRIEEGNYNFKFSEYGFKVIEIGSTSSKEAGPKSYDITVKGFFKPYVGMDGIYYANLDEPLMEKISREAEKEIMELLSKGVPTVKGIGITLEIQKGKYDGNATWNKNMELEKPFGLHIVLDATTSTKEDVLTDSKKIQEVLNESGYNYDTVTINANFIPEAGKGSKDEWGYVRYAFSFEKETKLSQKDIEELEK